MTVSRQEKNGIVMKESHARYVAKLLYVILTNSSHNQLIIKAHSLFLLGLLYSLSSISTMKGWLIVTICSLVLLICIVLLFVGGFYHHNSSEGGHIKYSEYLIKYSIKYSEYLIKYTINNLVSYQSKLIE